MLITGANGIVVFDGLRAGDGILYRITEIATVNGYVLLTEPVEIGTLPRENEESPIYDVSVTVSNSPTYLLPMTGGTGLWPGTLRRLCRGVYGPFSYRYFQK